VLIIWKNIESLKLSNKFNSFEEERGVEILALFPTNISTCSLVSLLKPRSHDTGIEFCRQKIITVSTVHTIPADYIPL
jgi:hypothetical protein